MAHSMNADVVGKAAKTLLATCSLRLRRTAWQTGGVADGLAVLLPFKHGHCSPLLFFDRVPSSPGVGQTGHCPDHRFCSLLRP